MTELSNELRSSRLSQLHRKWLELAEQFSFVGHCCVTQESPVQIFNVDGRGTQKRIGELQCNAYCRLPNLQDDDGRLNGLIFSDHADETTFLSSLRQGLWQWPVMRVLQWTDRVASYDHKDTENVRIPMDGDKREWIGSFAFERAWDQVATDVVYSWSESIASLSAESLIAFRDTQLSEPISSYYAVGPWLSIVYAALDSRTQISRVDNTSISDVSGARTKSGTPSTEVKASVCITESWLPYNFAAASADAIERLSVGPLPRAGRAKRGRKLGDRKPDEKENAVVRAHKHGQNLEVTAKTANVYTPDGRPDTKRVEKILRAYKKATPSHKFPTSN